ncbi:hypothetical protein ACH47Z_44160 [Streptomyces sp. NPDC020192]|uniref:hypothetical protein n=1 Tax=Streptomyces sp. NPDC020192 TaxID=3365066 RepID=UPI00379B54E5
MTRAQLTDEEWEFIGSYLPIGRYDPYLERLRQQFDRVMEHLGAVSEYLGYGRG